MKIIFLLGMLMLSAANVTHASDIFGEQHAFLLKSTVNSSDMSKSMSMLQGVIDDRNKIQMCLFANGEKLVGYYFFVQSKSYKIKRTELAGSCDAAGHMILNEITYDYTGDEDKEIETFAFAGQVADGQLSSQGPVSVSGTWYHKGIKKPFTLTKQFVLDNGLPIATERIVKGNKKANYNVHVEYPQIRVLEDRNAQKFNDVVKSIISQHLQDFRTDFIDNADVSDETGTLLKNSRYLLDIAYEIKNLKSNIISVKIDCFHDTGGAHGQYETDVINFDLAKGKLLRLSDFFPAKSPYLTILSQECKRALLAVDPSRYEGGMVWELNAGTKPTAWNYSYWNLTPYGLLITFIPYQVASFGEGSSEVVVPYEVVGIK